MTRALDGQRGSADRQKSRALTALGSVGGLCLLWLLCSHLFGLTAIVFETGSMSPTAPTGALAISRTTAASDLRVGDIVTVRRELDGLPVTHRIVAVRYAAATSGAASGTASGTDALLTLRGDANRVADQQTYRVASAPRVLIAVPGLGAVLQNVRTPMNLALLTLLVGCAIAWAFWPASDEIDGLQEVPHALA